MSVSYGVASASELKDYLSKLEVENFACIFDMVGLESPISGYYSGCNYWRNRGNHPWEPLGSVTAMHDCDVCDELDTCELKQKEPIWFVGV